MLLRLISDRNDYLALWNRFHAWCRTRLSSLVVQALITPVSESALAVPFGAIPDESHRAAFSSSDSALSTGRSAIGAG